MGVPTSAGRWFKSLPLGDGVMEGKEGLCRRAVEDGFGEVKLFTEARG